MIDRTNLGHEPTAADVTIANGPEDRLPISDPHFLRYEVRAPSAIRDSRRGMGTRGLEPGCRR